MTSGNPTHIKTSTNTNTTTTNSLYSFEAFLQGWNNKQDDLLDEIITVLGDNKDGSGSGSGSGGGGGGGGGEEEAAEVAEVAEELIARALGHFEEYYEHKSRAAHDNVFSMFSPPWCSSFECAFLWVAGFRPGVLLELVTDSVPDLSLSQTQAIDRLKRETRLEEKSIADDIARIQENTAAPPMINTLRMTPIWSEEEQSLRPTTNEALDQLQVVLEEAVANADTLRVTTAARVAEILTPPQGLRFLAAVIKQQQGMRKVGRIGRDNRPTGRGRSS